MFKTIKLISTLATISKDLAKAAVEDNLTIDTARDIMVKAVAAFVEHQGVEKSRLNLLKNAHRNTRHARWAINVANKLESIKDYLEGFATGKTFSAMESSALYHELGVMPVEEAIRRSFNRGASMRVKQPSSEVRYDN
jgi:hypothetical protein